MTREIITVDYTMNTYDTGKMDSWSKEQWKEWVGEPEDHKGIQMLLMNDNTFHLEIMGIYYNEETGEMFFGFDAQNKFDRDIKIQFDRWEIDESTYDLSNEKSQYMEKHSDKRGFQRSVERSYLESWDRITFELNLLDAETNVSIREFEFQINKHFIEVF